MSSDIVLMIGKSGMRQTYFVVIYIIYMNLIYMERGSVEANFSLHGCKTANFTYFKNVSGVCALSCFRSHTCCNQKSIIIRFPDDTCFLIIVKSFREACIFDCNVKSFHNSPYLMHNP